MYFTLEFIFSLTKHDKNHKSLEMSETTQIWRKSLNFQPQPRPSLSGQGEARLRQRSGTGSHIPQGVFGPPHTFSFTSGLEIWL